MMPGTELRWGGFAGGPDPMGPAVGLFKYVVFKDPNWDWRTLDFDRDVAAADKTGLVEPLNPDIRRFVQRGGKLLMYHGWADQALAPLSTVKFYESVQTALGGVSNASKAVRLFMAPGMGHCRGGEGPNIFDTVDAIERWVEEGKAPDRMIASHNTDGRVDRTRPLCPYPQVARYKGTGSTDEAANFSCKAP
jgi:feruloyl esterase